jgi:hypothetical protein
LCDVVLIHSKVTVFFFFFCWVFFFFFPNFCVKTERLEQVARGQMSSALCALLDATFEAFYSTPLAQVLPVLCW